VTKILIVSATEFPEKVVDKEQGPEVFEWSKEVKFENSAFLGRLEGRILYEYCNWSGFIRLRMEVYDDEQVYFSGVFYVLRSNFRTAIARYKDTKEFKIPIKLRIKAQDKLRVTITVNALTGWIRLSLKDLRITP